MPASNRQIAEELVLGLETVKSHMRALFERLSWVRSRNTRSVRRSLSARSSSGSSRRAI